MTSKDFKEGMRVTCLIHGLNVEDAKLHFNNSLWYICQNDRKGNDTVNDMLGHKYGYKHAWCIFNDWDDIIPGKYDVAYIQPKLRTIDDLECGDYVVKEDGDKRKCFGKCGEIYGMSSRYDFTSHDNWWTLQHLKDAGYTLYQPTEVKETDIDKCIKVVEEYLDNSATTIDGRYVCTELVQELKNLKK